MVQTIPEGTLSGDHIFCVGVNLIWPKTIKVANLLPSLLVAVVMTYVGV